MVGVRGLTGLLAALLFGAAALVLPRPADACTGFWTPFADAVPHAASIYFAHVETATAGSSGIASLHVRPGFVVKGEAPAMIPRIVAGPTACNGIEAGEDGVVVLMRSTDLGKPTAFGQNLFYRIGHPFGTSRGLITEALRDQDLPDTAIAPPGADDPDRPHVDPGVWPVVVFIVALFVFGLVVRGSRERRPSDGSPADRRPGGTAAARQHIRPVRHERTMMQDAAATYGSTSSAARTRSGDPPAVTTSPPSA